MFPIDSGQNLTFCVGYTPGIAPFVSEGNMKILWIAHRDPLNPMAGGAERTILELCKRFSSSSHEVTLLTSGWNGCAPISRLQGFDVIRFGGPASFHLFVPFFLVEHSFDVVINDLGHAVPWISTQFLAKKNVVFFHHLHARSLKGQVGPFMACLLMAVEKSYHFIYHSTKFVTESQSSEIDLKSINIKSEDIIRIPPGVDKSIFHEVPKTELPSIVYFGGMRRYKRPAETLYAFESVLREIPKAELTVVGDGPELANLTTLSTSLHIQNRVRFMGHLDIWKLADIVAKSWLNLHTSMTEGWGFSILEASASGTPTVAYEVAGVKDSVENGRNGILVVDGDRKALAEAAIKILKNPTPWWVSSQEIAKRYSWEKTAEKWETLLRTL